jgi:hypothetical protein
MELDALLASAPLARDAQILVAVEDLAKLSHRGSGSTWRRSTVRSPGSSRRVRTSCMSWVQEIRNRPGMDVW